MSKKVSRSFYYYDIEIYSRDIVSDSVKPVADFTSVIMDIFDKIKRLEYIDAAPYGTNTLIYKTRYDDTLFAIVDKIADTIDIRFILSRKGALPYVENEGAIRPLADYLPSLQAGLAEVTHMVIFPEYKVVGSEYNYFGPRPSAITYYLTSKVPDIATIRMDPLINKDTLQKLRDDPELSLLSLSVRPNSRLISELIKDENLLRSTDQTLNIDSVDIVLRRRITKKKPGFRMPLTPERWIKALSSKEKEDFRNFLIKEKDHKEPVDLLADKLVVKETFVPMDNTRTIEKEEAYYTIKKYFNSTIKDYCSGIQD